MTDEEEVGYIIVLRFLIWRVGMQVPGSTIIMANCGHEAWISPEGLAFALGDGAMHYTMCDDCLKIEDVLADKENKQMRAIPGLRESLARALSPEDVEKMMAWGRSHGIKMEEGDADDRDDDGEAGH